MTESLPRCLLAWVVACGVAWTFGLLLAVVDLWERTGMKFLIVKHAANPFMAGTIDVGWRVKCSDGHHDVMWGNTKNDTTLECLIEDVIDRYGQVTVIDERQNNST